VDLVGPVPAEFQSYVSFAGGIAATAHDTEGAKALIQFLASPKIAPILKAKGMEQK
jgi:ABC-type molybdate transport system substrate-binding protein